MPQLLIGANQAAKFLEIPSDVGVWPGGGNDGFTATGNSIPLSRTKAIQELDCEIAALEKLRADLVGIGVVVPAKKIGFSREMDQLVSAREVEVVHRCLRILHAVRSESVIAAHARVSLIEREGRVRSVIGQCAVREGLA